MRPLVALFASTVLSIGFSLPMARAGDETPAPPAHGGVILEIAGGDVHMEWVHDPREGLVTVYATARDARKEAFDEAPVLVVGTDAGPKEILLSRVAGETDVWRARNATLLKATPLVGQIRAKIGGHWAETSVAPSSVIAVHGGVLLDVAPGVGRVELVHDPVSGTATLFAMPDAGKAFDMDDAPTLLVSTDAGAREVTLSKVDGAKDQWRATNIAALKTDVRLTGELRFRVGGARYALAVELPVPVAVVPASLTNAPAAHGGTIVVLGSGEVELVHDPASASIALYPVGTRAPSFRGPPVVLLVTPKGTREIPLLIAAGSWRATEPAFGDPLADLRIRANVDGKNVETPLVRRGPHGGAILAVTAPDTLLEWVHADRSKNATVHFVAPPGAAAPEALVLTLPTAAGPVEHPLVLAEPNRWTLTDDALATQPLRGSLRWKTKDGAREVELPRPPDAPSK